MLDAMINTKPILADGVGFGMRLCRRSVMFTLQIHNEMHDQTAKRYEESEKFVVASSLPSMWPSI